MMVKDGLVQLMMLVFLVHDRINKVFIRIILVNGCTLMEQSQKHILVQC